MDIRAEIFTEGDSSEYKASRGAQAKLNDFMQDTPIGRIVSITTNTTGALDSNGTWFVYTLTLVYEPQAVQTTSEDTQEKLDAIIKRLADASDALMRIHRDDVLSKADAAICFALNELDELKEELARQQAQASAGEE